jgi:uncharacterized membrane protein YbhN (UPF0104 family)
MLTIDPFMKAGLIAFFIPTILGCLSYLFATLLAYSISSQPRHIYLWRLVFLGVFVTLALIYSTPHYAFSGPLERWLPIKVRLDGYYYGTFTIPIWLIIALLKRPKSKHDTAA